jgi:hypothetical protein
MYLLAWSGTGMPDILEKSESTSAWKCFIMELQPSHFLRYARMKPNVTGLNLSLQASHHEVLCVFLSPFRQMLSQNLKIGHDQFFVLLPNLSFIIFIPAIQNYIRSWEDIISTLSSSYRTWLFPQQIQAILTLQHQFPRLIHNSVSSHDANLCMVWTRYSIWRLNVLCPQGRTSFKSLPSLKG